MLISCQNCATSYQVDPSSLGPAGRSVRCARCQRVWFAANSMALAEIAQAHRADLAALAAPSASADSVEPQPEPGAQEIFVESPPIADPTPVLESAVAWDAPLVDPGQRDGAACCRSVGR